MPRVLRFHRAESSKTQQPRELPDSFEVIEVTGPAQALQVLDEGRIDGIILGSDGDIEGDCRAEDLVRAASMIDNMPDGIALLDRDNNIVAANPKIADWFGAEGLIGNNFYQAMGNPNIIGAELSPLTTSFARKTKCTATMFVNEKYYQLNVSPVLDSHGQPVQLVVTLRDSTYYTLQRKKMEALHQAGMALADLRPEEIFEMDVENRIELLKENILHYTQDLLNYDIVEIRLIDEKTSRLEPLLSVGIDSDYAKMPLYAKAQDNGVTGFVAATGNSYLCEDTTNDPLYLDGHVGAKSSLTVPLIYHDRVIGSFNVESPEIGAFSESDLQFVESFARDIAQALNTLELLVAQRTNAAQQSVDAIHAAVALPIDEILNDTVQVMESYIGHNPDVVKRLKKILKNSRDIKQVIQKVGEAMAPDEAVPASIQIEKRPHLKRKNILVIDADEQVRTSAHNLLEKYGCVVETAHEGTEAILMIRNSDELYDAVIADIRLPDISGYELLLKLKEITGQASPNLILMTGFGYDPGHSIVKARKEGLKPGAVLYKPFRLDQLLTIVENIVVSEQSGA
ncbi:MAG: response regulator [Planctomycetota bacterium]